jgi:hypothetical protein
MLVSSLRVNELQNMVRGGLWCAAKDARVFVGDVIDAQWRNAVDVRNATPARYAPSVYRGKNHDIQHERSGGAVCHRPDGTAARSWSYNVVIEGRGG